MKITVTPFCQHPDGYTDHLTIEGSRVIIDRHGVLLDGQPVVWRNRRQLRNRESGHPWIGPSINRAWSGFRVEVEP